MAALKEVRKRIKAVQGIAQVTNAMKMVATVKMKRIHDRLLKARPYVETLYDIAGKLAAAQADEGPAHPLLARRSTGAGMIVVVGSDRGLCGSFNTNLFRFTLGQVQGATPTLVLVGRKAKEFFKRQRYRIEKTYEKLAFPCDWKEVERIAHELVGIYRDPAVQHIRIAYQRFVSPGVSRPTLAPWLPFAQEQAGGSGTMRCEPSAAEVLDAVLPRALAAQLYRALLESQVSEQGARMVAMDNATSNASELGDDLTLLLNKLRQSGITKELLEITTGAEALQN